MKSLKNIAVLMISVFALSACANDTSTQNDHNSVKINMDVEKINYNVDVCAFTNDTIKTVRYGGRIELNDGTIYNFKSAEGTAAFYLEMDDTSKIKSIKVTDFAHGAQLLPVNDLKFLRSPLRPSPDGLFLTAVDANNEKMLTYVYEAYPGNYLTWDEVLDVVKSEMDLVAHKANPTIKKNRAE